MEVDQDDVWSAFATSPRASPPPAISTALSLNTRLHLLAASGGIVGGVGCTFRPGVGIGRGCYGNVTASPSSSYFSAAAGSSFPRLAPLDAGPSAAAASSSFPRLAPLDAGPSAAAASWSIANGVERRKKRMMKNRESASRSRARKHAQVAQIEREVEELREANKQLRLKYEQLKATVEVSVPVTKTLKRVLSAPF